MQLPQALSPPPACLGPDRLRPEPEVSALQLVDAPESVGGQLPGRSPAWDLAHALGGSHAFPQRIGISIRTASGNPATSTHNGPVPLLSVGMTRHATGFAVSASTIEPIRVGL